MECAGNNSVDVAYLILKHSELFEKYGLSPVVAVFEMERNSSKKTALGALTALCTLDGKINSQSEFNLAAISFRFDSVTLAAVIANHLNDVNSATVKGAIGVANTIHSVCDKMGKEQQEVFSNLFDYFSSKLAWNQRTYAEDVRLLVHLCADLASQKSANSDLVRLLADNFPAKSAGHPLTLVDVNMLSSNLSKIPFKSEIPESAFLAAAPLLAKMFFDRSGKKVDGMLEQCTDIADTLSQMGGMHCERMKQEIGDIFYALLVLNEKGAVINVAQYFNIDFFLRYPPELLQELAMLTENRHLNEDKPLAIVVLTKEDYNGAFYADHEIYKTMLSQYRVVVYEAGSENDFSMVLKTARMNFGYVHTAVFGAHGTAHSMDLGQGEEPGPGNSKMSNAEFRERYEHLFLDVTDIKKLPAFFSDVFLPDKPAYIFLMACSTGKKEHSQLSRLNMEETIAASVPPNVSVIAPEEDASIVGIALTRKFGPFGQLVPVMSYSYDTGLSAGRKIRGSFRSE